MKNIRPVINCSMHRKGLSVGRMHRWRWSELREEKEKLLLSTVTVVEMSRIWKNIKLFWHKMAHCISTLLVHSSNSRIKMTINKNDNDWQRNKITSNKNEILTRNCRKALNTRHIPNKGIKSQSLIHGWGLLISHYLATLLEKIKHWSYYT